MGRKKTEINPIRAERVKMILEREKITQTELAERIFQTQQNISRIMQKKQPLTEETARLIIDAFPDSWYRIEWLLGYDDAMTFEEWADKIQYQKDSVADAMWAIIEKSLNKQGKSLRFVHRQGEHPDSSSRMRADCFYTVVDRDGNVLKKLSAVEMARFEMQIQEYCDFLTEKHL